MTSGYTGRTSPPSGGRVVLRLHIACKEKYCYIMCNLKYINFKLKIYFLYISAAHMTHLLLIHAIIKLANYEELQLYS